MSSFSTSQVFFAEICDNIFRWEIMIGKALKYMRKINNFSQEQISNITNIGRSTISDYERGKTDINFENLEKIANICNFEIFFYNKKTKEKFRIKELSRKID